MNIVNLQMMEKYLKSYRIFFLLAGLSLITLLSACNSRTKLSNRTLILSVKRNGNHLVYVNNSIKKQPFYKYESNAPLYEAIVYSKKGKKLGTFQFGKIFFTNKGPVHQLTFPYHPDLHRILIYKLDASSGHITNKNKIVAMNWIMKDK